MEMQNRTERRRERQASLMQVFRRLFQLVDLLDARDPRQTSLVFKGGEGLFQAHLHAPLVGGIQEALSFCGRFPVETLDAGKLR